jgi:DNA-binding NarL/FixJ family response regulator
MFSRTPSIWNSEPPSAKLPLEKRCSTRRSSRRSALKGERHAGLTQRELEVLQMIVDGKSNKEIAAVLDLSANTIAVHRANMMDALGIHKSAELVVYAIRNGLVDLP